MSDLDEPLKPRRTRRVKDPVSPFLSAVAAPEPASTPTTSQPEPPKPAVAEVANVRTRYAMPVFLASQKKVLAPGTVYPVIVDNWVRRQLSLPAGAIVKV